MKSNLILKQASRKGQFRTWGILCIKISGKSSNQADSLRYFNWAQIAKHFSIYWLIARKEILVIVMSNKQHLISFERLISAPSSLIKDQALQRRNNNSTKVAVSRTKKNKHTHKKSIVISKRVDSPKKIKQKRETI